MQEGTSYQHNNLVWFVLTIIIFPIPEQRSKTNEKRKVWSYQLVQMFVPVSTLKTNTMYVFKIHIIMNNDMYRNIEFWNVFGINLHQGRIYLAYTCMSLLTCIKVPIFVNHAMIRNHYWFNSWINTHSWHTCSQIVQRQSSTEVHHPLCCAW